jgi:hypothetical protein
MLALLFDITEMYTPRLKLHKSRNYDKDAVISEGEILLGIPELSKLVGLTNTLI